jgi:tRNA pseudouridine55 synthase
MTADHRDGLVLIDKPDGITSHDAVEIFRRSTRIKKVGHTGTLDPMATGLLVLCVGKATRLQAFLMKMEKVYEGTIQFGWGTDSYDATGVAVGEAREASLEGIDLQALTERFRGEIEQMPPQFSAKKVQGVRAYELARRGETAALEAKRVTLYDFEIERAGDSVARFRIRCSAGTYVRSLAHDLGVASGLGAHLKTLRRSAIGAFRVEDALEVDRLRELPVEAIFTTPYFQKLGEVDLPFQRLMVDRSQETKLGRGQSIIAKPLGPGFAAGNLVCLVTVDGDLVAIAEVSEVLREEGPVVLQPKVVLRE